MTTKRVIQPADPAEHPYQLGKNYFIRTVTHYYTGRLVRVTAQELVLEDAAWIADTGRFANALETGELQEVEPFPVGQVIVGRGAVVAHSYAMSRSFHRVALSVK